MWDLGLGLIGGTLKTWTRALRFEGVGPAIRPRHQNNKKRKQKIYNTSRQHLPFGPGPGPGALGVLSAGILLCLLTFLLFWGLGRQIHNVNKFWDLGLGLIEGP